MEKETEGRPLTSLLDLLVAGSDDLLHELAAHESLGAPLIEALLPHSLHFMLDESVQLPLLLLLLGHQPRQVLPVATVLLTQVHLSTAKRENEHFNNNNEELS